MSRRPLFYLGGTLFCLIFVFCAWRAVGRSVAQSVESRSGKKVIRVAHYQLESGLREAFAAVARAYERTHPDVAVETMDIPSQVYDSWLRVQLVGGQAPDLVELGTGGVNEELLAGYFVPLTSVVESPNPYLAGTSLADQRWRDTFADGVQTAPSFNSALYEVYGVPNALLTVRIFYNQKLWREICGNAQPPRSYPEFVEVCRRAANHRAADGTPLHAIVSGKNTAALMFNRLFECQTQRTMLGLPGNEAGLSENQDRLTALAALRQDWTLTTPAVHAGLALVNRTSSLLPAGFIQMEREEALTQFIQGRALMIFTGVWEAPSMRALAGFPFGAFVLPLPTPADPEFGRYMLGPLSEAGMNTQAVFGLTQQSRHQEVALDFLRFMTGSEGSRIFTQSSGWPSALIGSPPPEGDETFAPVLEGFPGGLQARFNLQGSANSLPRLFGSNLHLLAGSQGSVDAFVAAVGPQMQTAALEDTIRAARVWRQTTARQDTMLYALRALGESDPAQARKASAMAAVQA